MVDMYAQHIIFEGNKPFGSPPGRCIYCDARDVRLTDEHIVAYCLAVDTYLPKSSCENCNSITSYLEGYAGRHIFGPMRQHFQIQSRRKASDLGVIDVTFFKEDGKARSHAFARSALPAIVVLPILAQPGLMTGVSSGPIRDFDPWAWFADDLDSHMREHFQDGEVRWELQHHLNAVVFARVLAKVAHAATVGWLGPDAFKPYLREFILGRDLSSAGYLIGGAEPPTDPLPKQEYSKKTLHHRLAIIPMSAEGKPDILAVSIRLFLHIGSPTYWVIVGEPMAETIKRLTVAPSSVS